MSILQNLNTLAPLNYLITETITPVGAMDVIVSVECATTNTPTGHKLIAIFAKTSLDGITYSGTEVTSTTCNEQNEVFVGVIPVTTANKTASYNFSLNSVFGFTPAYTKLILKNDLGVALTSGTVSTQRIVSGIVASDGLLVDPTGVAAHSFTYDASGNMATDTFVDSNGNTYRQTFTWTNGNLTATSNWVKQ
jgi:hypothetical protein